VSSYQDEKEELFEWSKQELDRIHREYPHKSGMLDGELSLESKNLTREFNKRLLALKDKYGIDIAATG